ncbi:phosphotransferase [Isoptericola variabilis]|uniref:phosphotransferase n=1 Tax=Isoptericola variabilis TaxID=139208 RepID=UPI00031B24AE|nr:phosphotransferase [Isoptericola variabilis]TWH28316.1 Mn2+-dependent serine/threonine protein kinase [Isoptericola variabilis J7]
MELLASGRDADVYALDERRVVRRYRDGRPAAREAALLSKVVAAGFPAPAVLAVDGPEMVLERIDGPTLAEALLALEVTPAAAGAIMARLHAALHAVDWDGGTLVHLDLHPLNVISRPTGRGSSTGRTRGPARPRWTSR